MDNSNTTHLKREVLVRLIRAFINQEMGSIRELPFQMRPKNGDAPYRCCIYKERATLRQRAIAGLGCSVETDDEMTSLNEYAKQAMERKEPEGEILTVVDAACKGCVPSRVYVTELCQGCVARPCVSTCKFGAIQIKDGRSVIDGEKCKNCGMCISVCPYSAIVKLKVPCEDACPVGAIHKNEMGHAVIDFDKCISCGACVGACPFAAVHEKSEVIDVLKAMRDGKRVVAMLAPAVVGQLPVSINKIAQALVESGFSEVFEVAQGADTTARTEAEDFKERMEKGNEFMTTSCCAAYNELVDKHIPEMKPFRSETRTPMHYTAEFVKNKYPDAVTVFIGPCVAKRKEAQKDEYTDLVMNFEEMGALFVARGIEVANCKDYEFANEASKEGRNFAITGGVAQSVKVALKDFPELFPTCVNGLNPKSVRDLKNWAKKGQCPEGNLVEIMACEGGCVAGSACLNNKRITTKKVSEYANSSKCINDLDSCEAKKETLNK